MLVGGCALSQKLNYSHIAGRSANQRSRIKLYCQIFYSFCYISISFFTQIPPGYLVKIPNQRYFQPYKRSFRAGNTTDLVFFARKPTKNLSCQSPVAQLLTDHKVYFEVCVLHKCTNFLHCLFTLFILSVLNLEYKSLVATTYMIVLSAGIPEFKNSGKAHEVSYSRNLIDKTFSKDIT